MEQVIHLWAALRQHLDAWVGQLRGASPDHLLLLAALACLVTFLILISRLRARQAYRRLRDERDDLKQQLATLQSDYDKEVRWRTASEKHFASKATNSKDAVEVERR